MAAHDRIATMLLLLGLSLGGASTNVLAQPRALVQGWEETNREALYRLGEGEAQSALSAAGLPSRGPYAFRTRYLAGAALLSLEHFTEAEAEFQALVALPLPQSAAERRAVELAYLSLGRIYAAQAEERENAEARNALEKAYRAYFHISPKSDLFQVALYEAAQTAIRAHDLPRAEQALKHLLRAYRDGEKTSFAATRAKLLLGQLHLRRGELDHALAWFEKARHAATSVVEALAEYLAPPDPAKLRAFLARLEPEHPGFELGQVAPKAALPLVAAAQSAQTQFSEVLVHAEAGLLDVAWARRLFYTEHIRALVRAQNQAASRQRPHELGSEYAARVDAAAQAARAHRTYAIAQFEQFLDRYPRHPRYTPDAMFRLAELYFERSREALAAPVTQTSARGNSLGQPAYSDSVLLYTRLIREYPRYHLNDGVYYRLGYCLGEMGKEVESRQALLGLLCRNHFRPLGPPAPLPNRTSREDLYTDCQPQNGESPFLSEAWLRIGEQHFEAGELLAAIAAYRQVLPFRDSPVYEKALYKLAWSFYRSNRFRDAVQHFDAFVTHAGKRPFDSNAGDRSLLVQPSQAGSTRRKEAINYLALSFAERDWNGDGRIDLDWGLARLLNFYRSRESEPQVREVLIRLGDIWFERTEFARAAEAYKRAIAHTPLAADNAQLEQRILAAFERLANASPKVSSRNLRRRRRRLFAPRHRRRGFSSQAPILADGRAQNVALPVSFRQVRRRPRVQFLWLRRAVFVFFVGVLCAARADAADLYGGGSDLDGELRSLLASPEPEKRRQGIEQLAGLEPRLAAPHLLSRLRDADASVRARAARALGPSMLEDAAPLLIACLSDADSGVRSACAEALGQYGALPPGLVSRAAATLSRALGDGQYEVRVEALRAIMRLLHGRVLGQLETQQLLGPVLLHVEDEHVGVRHAATAVLGQLGPLMLPAELFRRAVMALLGRLSDSARDVRIEALTSLAALGAPEAGMAALRLLQDPAEEVRRQSLRYLGKIAYGAALPLIIEVFETGPESLRPAAAQALGAMAKAANSSPRATQALLLGLMRDDARPLARAALLELGGAGVPTLIARLEKGATGPAEVGALCDLLRDLGRTAGDTLPMAMRKQAALVLAEELRHGRLPREQVVEALAALADPASAQRLFGLLFDADVEVRRRAMAGLRQPGLLDVRALHALLSATRDSDSEVRIQATLALAELPKPAATRATPWLPRLCELVRTGDIETRLAAAQALGRSAQRKLLSEADDIAVTALLAALSSVSFGDTELRLRRAAAQALGKVAIAVPALQKATVQALLGLLRRGPKAKEAAAFPEAISALGHALRDAKSASPIGAEVAAAHKLLADLASASAEADSSEAALALDALDALGAMRAPESAGRIIYIVEPERRHDDPLRRVRAAAALGNLLTGPAAANAAAALIRVLKEDSDVRVIAEAAWAIGKLPRDAGPAARAIAALRYVLAARESAGATGLSSSPRHDRGVRTNVLGALFRLAKAEVSDAEWLADSDPGVRANAALLLSSLSAPSPGMLARLRNLASTDEDYRVRKNADWTLHALLATGPLGETSRNASTRRHFLTMFQMDPDRNPLSETAYRLTLSDGVVRVGLTDRRGISREELLPAGNADVELLFLPLR